MKIIHRSPRSRPANLLCLRRPYRAGSGRRLLAPMVGAAIACCATAAHVTAAHASAAHFTAAHFTAAHASARSISSAVPAVPFSYSVTSVTSADIPYTWRPGCPVSPAALRMLHLAYWGFDRTPHRGEMVVNASVVSSVVIVFRTLYNERFPVREMVPEDAYRGSDNAAATADDTSGFNCRYVVAPGPRRWSVHAFGEAIDVNDIQNPYVDGRTIIPRAGAAYLRRSDVRPGMAVPGGDLVRAFASVGWYWGGRWTSSPDYQHFSLTGG